MVAVYLLVTHWQVQGVDYGPCQGYKDCRNGFTCQALHLCLPVCQPGEVCIDLNSNEPVENSVDGIGIYDRRVTKRIVNGRPCSRQAVFKVTFDKLPADSTGLCHEGVYTKKRMLKVQMFLSNGARDGWLFDIGDSRTNNGWAGDAGSTEYEAEVQLLDKAIAVYANNVNRTDCKAQKLYSYPKGGAADVNKVNIWVANHYLKVANDAGLCETNCDKCLYGLNGQPTPGSVNQDVYVAVNRVVSTSSRHGRGVCYMKLSWVSGPEE